ncbi:MAG: 1-acyl-sn-glycerol-3-phosphate acyltransferase [Deltaproteobacteria bacterium]|nr:1-acyl-sn-glycerol-3-phosphate acyltransferase [Deltaproteobacteria bacterium]
MLWLAGAKLQEEPLPTLDWSRPFIFLVNHQSALDICCAFAALPRNLRFVAKHTLARVPLLGWYMWSTGMVFLNRSNRRQAVESLRRAGAAIRAGKSILVYPEGTRSHAPFALLPFKAGPFALAVEGSDRVMEAGSPALRTGMR